MTLVDFLIVSPSSTTSVKFCIVIFSNYMVKNAAAHPFLIFIYLSFLFYYFAVIDFSMRESELPLGRKYLSVTA